jgi:sulfite exporter TauE/SafE
MISTTILFLLGGCFGLGMLHAVIPDEHTWPITFAYSVGSTTGRGGMLSSAFFSLAFTGQRAVMSQLVYSAIAVFFVTSDTLNGPVYTVVGAAMAIAGYLILKNRVPHFHPLMRFSKKDLAKHTQEKSRGHAPGDPTVPIHWAMIHGFISGFGVDTGIMTTFVYLTTLPVLAAAGLWEIGWLPGALFGFGTFSVLMVIGFFFGQTLQVAKRFGANRIAAFGRLVGARVLLFGGLAFVFLGPAYYIGFSNYVPVDFGTFVVLLIMIAIAIPVMVLTWREVGKIPLVPEVPTTLETGAKHAAEEHAS